MEKILISTGIILSLGGLWFMIRASLYKDPNTGKTWAHRHDPEELIMRWGWICLIVGIIAQIVGIWFTDLFQGVSSAFPGTPSVKNITETEKIAYLDKISEDPELIVAGLALLATIFIAIASWLSVKFTKRTTQSQLYIKFFEEYASPNMKDALSELNRVKEFKEWDSLVTKYPKGSSELEAALISNDLIGDSTKRDIRYAKYYFIKALRLKNMGFISKRLLKAIGAVDGINLLYDVVKPFEKDSSVRSEIEEIEKICGRYKSI